MKPNDKAIEAALAAQREIVRQAELSGHLTSQLCMQEILSAAYAAQFKSKDYAVFVEGLRHSAILGRRFVMEPNRWVAQYEKAADAIEALLAERDTYKNWLDNYEKQFAAKVEELVTVRLERDALKAELDKAQEIARVQAERIGGYIKTIEDRDALLARLAPSDNDCIEIGEGIKVEGAKFVTHENSSMLASGRFYIDTSKYSRLVPVEASTDPLTNGMAVTMPDGEALVEIMAEYCYPEIGHATPEKWKHSCRRVARNAIAAVRPHIEAAERERCAKIAELCWTGSPDEIAEEIRSGK